MYVESGQLWHVTGPNGAGKTSLLRILAGLSQADQGSVTYPENKDSDIPLLYLGHKLAQSRHLSALENLNYWANMHGLTPELDALYSLLTKYQLVGLEDLPTGQLSAGQQRRVSLARTALVKTPLWILDEPYTSLDVDGVAFIQAEIDAFVASGGAVIMTSHQNLASTQKVNNLVLEYLL